MLRAVHSDAPYDGPQTSAYIPAFENQVAVYSIKPPHSFTSQHAPLYFKTIRLSVYNSLLSWWSFNSLPSQQKEQVTSYDCRERRAEAGWSAAQRRGLEERRRRRQHPHAQLCWWGAEPALAGCSQLSVPQFPYLQ